MVYVGYLLAQIAVRVLPPRLAFWVAERIGDIWFAASARLRSNLDHNLSLVPALSASRDARSRTARRAVCNFARVVAEFLYLPRMGTPALEHLVELGPFRELAATLGRNPAVLVTAHLGNWELGAAASAAAGLDLHVVVYDHPDPRVASLFRSIRQARGLKMVSVACAAPRLRSLISTVALGIAGDRDFTGHGMEAPLFGAATRVPSAYAALAQERGVAIIPAFCIRQADGRYHLESEPPLAGGAADGAAVVREYLAIVEKYVEKYPDQWYRFDSIVT